jgi:hypothetical protein
MRGSPTVIIIIIIMLRAVSSVSGLVGGESCGAPAGQIAGLR